MVTINNYFQKAKEIIFKKLPQSLQSFHTTMEWIAEDYGDDKEIKDAIDVYLNKLNSELEKASKPSKQAKKKTKVQKKVTQTKKRSSTAKSSSSAKKQVKKPVSKADPKLVGHIDPIIAIAKRYLSCESKVRTVEYMLRFLANVERQIISEKITKKDKNYSVIKKIETELQSIIGAAIGAGHEEIIITKFASLRRKELKKIAESQRVRPSVNAIKRYVGMSGKKDKEESAERLLKTIKNTLKKFPGDKHATKLRDIKKSLSDYVDGHDKPIPVDDITLAGVQVMSASDLASMNFKELGITGAWRDLLGALTVPFSLMVFGSPGSGKSTFAIKFAAYLAKSLNKRVLYVASEEGFSATLQEKFERVNAIHDNIDIVKTVPEDLSKYAIVFIDSVNNIRVTPEELEELVEYGKSRNISYVFIFRGTKDGTFRGEETFENIVDASIKLDHGKTVMRKNRFGGSGEMTIY